MLAALEIDLPGVLSRVLHTTCGATLLGGLIYLRFVLAPAATRGDVQGVCFAGRRGAWAACVGVCSGLLLLSGAYNFWVVITADAKPAAYYHALIGVKMILALAVFVLAALLAGKTQTAQRMRGQLTFWLNVTLACTLAIFLLGAVLRAVPRSQEPLTQEPLVVSQNETVRFAKRADGASLGLFQVHPALARSARPRILV